MFVVYISTRYAVNNPVDNSVDNYLKLALPQNGRMKMEINTRLEIKNELLARLKLAWVLAEADVMCETGAGALVLDIALQTNSFIYGNISIDSSPAQCQVMQKYKIEHKTCETIEDIDDCVAWAIDLQERHCRSQAVQMVA